MTFIFSSSLSFLNTRGHFSIAFREKGREGEKHQCEREALLATSGVDLYGGSYMSGPGIKPATQACALTGN